MVPFAILYAKVTSLVVVQVLRPHAIYMLMPPCCTTWAWREHLHGPAFDWAPHGPAFDWLLRPSLEYDMNCLHIQYMYTLYLNFALLTSYIMLKASDRLLRG